MMREQCRNAVSSLVFEGSGCDQTSCILGNGPVTGFCPRYYRSLVWRSRKASNAELDINVLHPQAPCVTDILSLRIQYTDLD